MSNFESNFFPCDEVKELLSAYFDGELDEKDNKIVKKHLRECLNCRRELENIKQLSVLIKSSYSASPLFVKRKQNRLKKVISSSIAALMFLVFLGWFSVSMVNTNKTSTIETDKPMYVKSEDYFLSDVYSEPPQEVVSLIYDE